MTNNNKYLPALSFGKIDNNNKFSEGRTITGERAYEAYHLHLLLNEIIEARHNEKTNISRIDRNSFIRFLMEISISENRKLEICELGSSLMEIIDGYEMMKKVHFPNIKEIYAPFFSGIEKSAFFNKVAKILHPNHSFNLYTQASDYPNKNNPNKISVLIDRAVSSYAFKDTNELCSFLTKFDVAILQIFGFKNSQKIIKDTIGTNLVYFNLNELNLKLDLFFHFYGFQRPTRPEILTKDKECIEGFFLYFASDNIYKVFKSNFSNTLVFKDYFKNKKNKGENLIDINIPSFF